MCRRWSGSFGSLLIVTCLTACSGSVSSNGLNKAGSPAAGGGGDGARDPDSGTAYDGDASTAGAGGSGGAGRGGSGGISRPSELVDVAPAQCLADPTSFTACGGDVTGKWRVASICLRSGLEDLRELWMCEALTQDFSYDYRMLIDFKESGDYSASVAAEAVQTVTLPLSCLGEEADCREVLGEDEPDDGDGSSVLIKTLEDGCSIEAREAEVRADSGTWEVSGSELTMTDSTGPSTSEYCVTGETLLVKNVHEVSGTVSWGIFERL